jgi:AcrR family transcriptional regulator
MTSPEERVETSSEARGVQRRIDWSKPRVTAILRAAVRCFARSGFDTTTAEIAAEIRIPKSVIYHYFDDKMTLVCEAQRFAYAEHLSRVREALNGVTERTGRAVVEAIRKALSFDEGQNIGFELGIWSELRNDSIVREQAVALQREHHKIVSEGVANSLKIDPADPSGTEPLSTLVVAALTGLSLNEFIEGDQKRAEEAHALFLELLDRGIERFAKRPDSEFPPASAPAAESERPPPYDGSDDRDPARHGM